MGDGWWVFCSVILSVSFSVFFVIWKFGVGQLSQGRLKSIFVLDVRKGLVHQGLLWLSIITPILLSVALGMWVWPKYEFDLSADGFKRFIEISVLPLAVMSISLPLSGLISKFHSTQQTAKQIEVVSYKNNLDAFYTHRKELIAYFAAMGEIEYLKVVSFSNSLHPVLHKRFFKGTPEEGTPVVDKGAFQSVERAILSGSKFLMGALENSGGLPALDCYLNACNEIFIAGDWLAIREIANGLMSKGVLVKSSKDEGVSFHFATVGTTTREILAAIRYVRGYYDNLCDYSGVPRMKIPEGREQVFGGGQSLLDKELVIEELHKNEILHLVGVGQARYGEDHEMSSKPS